MAKKETVLITGGAGFIGSHLAEALLSQGFKVVVFDNFQTGKFENLDQCTKSQDFFVLEGDINHRQSLRELHLFNPQYVYHYAACVGVKRTLAQPLSVLDDIDGIRNILDLAREKRVKRFLYSSSSEVYGESVSFPQNEKSTPLNSKLPYAAVKNLGEIYIRTFHSQYGLPYTIFRFFNTYGPRQSKEFVISRFISKALRGDDLQLYGGGDQTRSFLYIDENIKATTAALSHPKSVNRTINIGNPNETTVRQVAELVKNLIRSDSRIVTTPALKEGDMSRRKPDISLMKKLLDTTPGITLRQGLGKTIDYFRPIYEKS